MGNFSESYGSPITGEASPAKIRRFFSIKSWIEGEALRQLDEMARLQGSQCVAAFPDLHPGKYGATGVALLSERLHPLLIGNDLGCGMSFFALDLPLRKLRIDKAEERLRLLELQEVRDATEALLEVGLPADLYPEGLGTIGGGNHFCELQSVETLFGEASQSELDSQVLYLLVHSGSRGLGARVFSELVASQKDMTSGWDASTDQAIEWKLAHDQCVTWASLNRRFIAEKAAQSLRADLKLVADIPHNLVRQTTQGFVHHKGAAAVSTGDLAPIAGSRASLSYIVRAKDEVDQSLNAISHGAGRKYDRSTMHGRVGKQRSEREQLARNEWGGRAICDDRSLLIEEAATAYKDSEQVVKDLEEHQLIERVATMRPLITYKKVLDRADQVKERRKEKHERRHPHGRR